MGDGRIDRVVVDTDVLIDYFSGISPSGEAVERLLREDRLIVTTLTLFELACGSESDEQLQDLELLMLTTTGIELSVGAAILAGAVYRALKTQGQLIAISDLLIAGCCLEIDFPLLTRNQEHFTRIEGLELVEPSDILG